MERCLTCHRAFVDGACPSCATRPPPGLTAEVELQARGTPATLRSPVLQAARPAGVDPLIGQEPLGQYRIVEKIGEGGFGAAYLAEQAEVGRKAVIKVLRRELSGSEVLARRFRREAVVLAALDHQHLVRLYNFGELDDGQLFIAMEYGGDRTLADELARQGRFSQERGLLITEQVCAALQEAHDKGVVHRDLKPSNILLGTKNEQDWVKVVDVGIARILRDAGGDEERARLTGSGAVLGTPMYFSPEQGRGLPLDGRSDVYAMGCVLYEMLSGKLPIEARTPADYVRAHAVDAPIPLRARGVRVDAAVDALLRRALAKAPDQRMSAAQMQQWAAQARAALGKPRRSRLPLAACALALVAALALAAWKQRTAAPAARVTPAAAGAMAPVTPPAAVSMAPVTPPAAPAPSASAPARGSAAGYAPPTLPAAGPATIAAALPPASGAADPQHRRLAPKPAVAARAAPPAEGPSAAEQAGLAQIESLAAARRLKEAIAAGEKMLGDGPSPAVKASLYRMLAQSYYDFGDNVGALRYSVLYRQHCPAADQPALDRKIARLRVDLGFSPGP